MTSDTPADGLMHPALVAKIAAAAQEEGRNPREPVEEAVERIGHLRQDLTTLPVKFWSVFS